MAEVAPSTGLVRVEQTQFSLPDYLRAERDRRGQPMHLPGDETGTGSGLVWTGAILATAAVILTKMDSWGVVALGVAVALVLMGFWRMRRNQQALARAGLAIMALAGVTLAAVLFQVVGLQHDARGVDVESPIGVVASPTSQSPAPSTAGASEGAIAMYGGTADHAGIHPGPAPVGRPVTKWRQFTGGEVYSSPVIVDGTLYIGTKSGFLAAYDVATGNERWRFDLGGYIVRATPAVAEGVVYIGAGYGVFAIDAATGEERWRVPIRFAGSASPNVANGAVFVATQEGHVYAFEAESGGELWHYEADGLIFGAPAVSDNKVYFASDSGGIHVMSAETGRLEWRHSQDAPIRGAPAIGAGGAYFNSERPALFAFDATTGEARWATEVGGEASPAVAGDTVFFGSDDHGLYAADAATGEIRWLFPTGSAVVTAPVVTGNTVYISGGSTLYAIDIRTGAADWTYPAGDLILTTPAVIDEVVYFGSRDGFLYAVAGNGASEVDGS
ncbi:MAG: PQQ-binding-like beta-propeller repeat protein [Chloroflexota bacterium]|nr:PQQ-binding-like beta-propeller repeat protein [Chloroflexota bacterium]